MATFNFVCFLSPLLSLKRYGTLHFLLYLPLTTNCHTRYRLEFSQSFTVLESFNTQMVILTCYLNHTPQSSLFTTLTRFISHG